MKKLHILLWLCIFCLLLPGCRNTQTPGQTDPSQESTVPTTAHTVPTPTLPGSQLELQNPGKLRIPYTGNRSSVQYITSASQLPDDEAFDQYDDAFFRENALLLVTETVGSGSVQVSIGSVWTSGNTATVVLSHSMPGDAGTTDMATWLLWAEVEAGLDLNWTVANAAVGSSLTIHTQ